MSNSTVKNRPAPTLSIAPSYPRSAADEATFAAASYVRPWLSSAGTEALRRAHAATQRWQNEQYDAALVERGLAEYREYLGSAA